MASSWIVRDKYHQTELATVELSSIEQVDRALIEAKNCFQNFKESSSEKRSELLYALHRELTQAKKELSELIMREAGKPIGYAQGEVERSLSTLKWAADECLRFGGDVIPMDFGAGKGRQAYTQRFPRGVCLGISPFNFPLNLAMHKLAPAVATGNTILIKPSPYTPLTLLKLEELCHKAGWPKGLFQVVCCDNDLSEWLVCHEDIKLLSFTGSPQVGWMLKEKAAKKKVVLELGGNAAVLVDETSDLKKTARLLAQGAFLYAGQICISTQRIYCVSEVADELKSHLIQAIEGLKAGDPSDDKVTVGPLIDSQHYQRIASWIEEAKSGGAKVLCGGSGDQDKSIFYPTLLEATNNEMQVCREEAFGPIAIFEKVNNFEDGLKAINDSRFGLQAGVFTQRIDRMKEAFQKLEVGGVIMNNIPGFRIDHMPYGGVKDSGHGREGLRYAMEDYTEEKLLVF